VDKLYLTESEAFSRRQSGQDLQTYAEERPSTADTGLPSLVPTNCGQVGVSEPSVPARTGVPVGTGTSAINMPAETGAPVGTGAPVPTGELSLPRAPRTSVASMAPMAQPSVVSSMAPMAQPSVVPARRFQPSRRAKQRRSN
jgi:hypothetical protein